MQATHFQLPDIGLCPPLISRYLKSDPNLLPFVANLPSAFNWDHVIQQRLTFSSKNRSSLVQVMKKRYQQEHIDITKSKIGDNLLKLEAENTLTVTTGHQLNLFTGPAYFVYKIVSTIKLAEELNAQFPKYNVVPVFWMASEDHDWEEVNHTFVFGQRIQAENKISGPVGRQDTHHVEQLLAEFKNVMNWPDDHPDFNIIEQSVKNHTGTWSSLVFQIVHALFYRHGLLILDADEKELKHLFSETMQRELFDQPSAQAIHSTTDLILQPGEAAQVNPRAINLFYMTNDLRTRIVFDGGRYKTADNAMGWSPEEMKKICQESPEFLSPNVVLRPVYQETILPNIAYVGGSGELSYWLQLKGVFDVFQIPFPNLILRNHAVVLDAVTMARLRKFSMQIEDVFKPLNELINAYIDQLGDIDLIEYRKTIQELTKSIKEQAVKIDPTLVKSVDASGQRMLNELNQIEKKMRKALKVSQESAINQIQKIHGAVFPDQVLQERRQNFFALNQLAQGELMKACMESFNPLAMDMTVLMSES